MKLNEKEYLMQTIQLEIENNVYEKILKSNKTMQDIINEFFVTIAQDLKLNKKIECKVLDK